MTSTARFTSGHRYNDAGPAKAFTQPGQHHPNVPTNYALKATQPSIHKAKLRRRAQRKANRWLRACRLR